MAEIDMFNTPLPEIERLLGFKPDTPCIYCEMPVLALSMGGALVCPACDCGRYRHDWPVESLRGKPWAKGHDWPKFYANAKRRMEALQKPPTET